MTDRRADSYVRPSEFGIRYFKLSEPLLSGSGTSARAYPMRFSEAEGWVKVSGAPLVAVYSGPRNVTGEVDDVVPAFFNAGSRHWEALPLPPGAAAPPVVFQLTEDLTLASSANAVICNLSGGAYVAGATSIVVEDCTFGNWAGVTGYRGIASQRSDGKYNIEFMERPSLIVKFTTVGDRDPSATVFTGHVELEFQQGGRPAPGKDGSGNITIQDVEKLFPRALDGGTGLAIWNDAVGVYQCLIVQQMTMLATALIDDTGGLFDTSATIDSFVAISPSPFNQTPNPLPTTAANWFRHRGKDNDEVLLAWDEIGEEWRIIDIVKHDRSVIMDIRIKEGNTAIEVLSTTCALEYTDDPVWSDKIDLEACE